MNKIIFKISSQSGVGWYRIHQPVQMINKLGLAKAWHNPFDPRGNKLKSKKKEAKRAEWYSFELDKNGNPRLTNLFEKLLGKPEKPNYDAVIFQRADVASMFSLAMMVRQAYNIPIIQEVDDYVFAIPGTNPAILSYKDRPTEYRTQGEDPLTIARMSLGTFDGYIVSTPFLKNFYENYSPTYVCPNSIDLSKRKQKKKKKHSDFRIMFSSSATHVDGIRFLMPTIDKFLTKYEDATFYLYKGLYGAIKNSIKDKPYKKRIKLMDWVHPKDYWNYIQSFSPDVCLAPAADVLFNRAKSNLRLLEYWTAGNNAVIASPVESYKNTIIEGKNGLLAKEENEWFEKIEYLYHNPKIREKLGKGGYETVKKDYNLEKNARKWTDAVQTIIDSYDPDRQPPEQYTPDYTPRSTGIG